MPKHFGHHLRELRHSHRQVQSSVYPESVQEIRRSLYWILEEPDASSDVPRVLTVGVACVNVLMILLSLVSLILETSPEFKKTTSEDLWQSIEILTTGCFTLEYLMRLWVCDVYGASAVDWFFKPLNVCDLLAIVPVYAEYVVRQWDLEFLRVLRVVRLFKIGRYSEGVRVMNAALFNSLSALYILVFLFVIGSVIFASIIYFTEKLSCPDFSNSNLTHFQNYNDECEVSTEGISDTFGTCCIFMCDVPTGLAGLPLCRPWLEDSTITVGRRLATEIKVEALHSVDIDSVLTGMWWAAVTMTTVGYGDIIPKHWSSALVAGFAMVTGVLIIAMPFAIVGTKFSEAAGDCAELESEDEGFNKLMESTSGLSQEKSIVPEISSKTLSAAPEMAVLLEELRMEMEEALTVKKEILQLQVFRDNLWTSVEHALARLAFEGCISLNAHMVDGPWFNRKVTKKAKTSVGTTFEKKSLGFITRDWCIRRAAIKITSSWLFESTVLFLIVANSFALAVQNFYYDQDDYWGNVLMRETEIVFTLFFALECAIKIVAYGFVGHPSAYIRDPWNWIDFLVVVVGLLDAMQFEALSFLKPARVLRPLRSLTAVPGIRNLFHTIILSLPGLKDVVLLAMFLLIMFGVLGLHFWSGLLHRSCRLTMQPLHFSSDVTQCAGWCFDNESMVNVSMASGHMLVDSSMVFDVFCRRDKLCSSTWESGKDYYIWPLDDSQERFCGEYKCQPRPLQSLGSEELQVLQLLGSIEENSSQVSTSCGSPLASDVEFGPQAANPELQGVNLNHWNLEVTGPSRNFGLTNFDNVAASFLVVFQSVTLEGWSDVMGMVQDAHSTVLGFIYFLLLIVIGSFFLVNVILAIIWDVFLNVREQQLEEEREADTQHVGTAELTLKAATDPDGGMRGHRGLCKEIIHQLFLHRSSTDVDDVLRDDSNYKAVRWARAIATNWLFNSGVMAMILINVIVLAMDRYPEHLVEASVGDVLNFIFNVVFLLECIILHVAVGPLVYWADNAMAFDGVIVLLSVVDLVNDFASGSDSGGSAITALRAFRMLRIFKLAKKFPSMKILLSAGVQTLMSMGDFVALLFLIICVFALMAQSFFGGTFMFDPDDGSLVAPEDYREKCPFGDGDKPICVPRSHFDTFLWSFITIFQILTGENWNTVMYDGMRATGWISVFFFLMVVLFGNFVILNLFLAILMSSFDEQRSKLHEAMESKRELSRATQVDQRWAWDSGALAVIPGRAQAGVSPRSGGSRFTTRFTEKFSWISRMELWGDQNKEACAKRCGERSCFFFSRDGEIRKACLALTAIPAFDHVIMVFIGFSSVVMAFENPLHDPNSTQVKVLEVLSTVFTVIFLLEVVVKMIALGAFCNYGDGRKAYLRSFENVLDFVIVIVSVLDSIQTWLLVGSSGGVIAVMKIFRVVRMLRPLRLISRSKNLKVVVKTILAAIPELRNLLVFSSLFFLIFGLLAVGNLKGSYHSCKDHMLEDYGFSRSPETTLMCIADTVVDSSSNVSWGIMSQSPGTCSSGREWQRLTKDTPICEVHCDSSSHPACQTSPWGYHVMRCSDCSEANCPESSQDLSRRDSCQQRCARHEYFCKGGGAECLEQCVAACICESSCWGLIEDAALCTEQGGKWVNLNQNFDNLLVGTIALFEISTTEGWVDVMLAAVDSRGPYLQPRRDANEFIGSMLFVAFMLIGSFFVLNLCVGVIIDNYNKQKKESDIHFANTASLP